MLRKHLSTSCKLRRGSDGEAAPLTSAEEDAIIPRKRRRTKARAAVSPAPSSSSSVSASDERVRRVPASSSSASSASTKVATPVSPATPASAVSVLSPSSPGPGDDRMSAHYARLRSLASFQAAGGRLSSSLPAASEAPAVARAGASLDTPLAPAFAATPETFGDLAFPTLSAGLSTSLSSLASLPSFGAVSPKTAPATIAPSAVSAASGAPAAAPAASAAKEQPTWSTSANDDLLSWLFSVTNTVPPSAMAPGLSSSASSSVSSAASSSSSSASVGSVDAWPVTPSESSRKLSDACDALERERERERERELADLALLPDLPEYAAGGGGSSIGLGGLGGLGALGLGLGVAPAGDDFGLGGFAAIRGLPGMPEFGDKGGHDWLAPPAGAGAAAAAAAAPPAPAAPAAAPKDKYDPYAYDQSTMAQMRVYYELYFKA